LSPHIPKHNTCLKTRRHDNEMHQQHVTLQASRRKTRRCGCD
jgi:hypothetical protein